MMFCSVCKPYCGGFISCSAIAVLAVDNERGRCPRRCRKLEAPPEAFSSGRTALAVSTAVNSRHNSTLRELVPR